MFDALATTAAAPAAPPKLLAPQQINELLQQLLSSPPLQQTHIMTTLARAARERTANECLERAVHVLPGRLVALIGPATADRGMRGLWEFLQCRHLVKDLLFHVLDKLLWRMFQDEQMVRVVRELQREVAAAAR